MSYRERDTAGPLFDRATTKPVSKPARSLEGAFREWIRENPHVLARFTAVALSALHDGKRLGAKAIVERLRWEWDVATSIPAGHDGFKMPNAYTSFLARLAMHRTPALANYFDLATQAVPFDPAGLDAPIARRA